MLEAEPWLWTLLLEVEDHTSSLYQAQAPELYTARKKATLASISELAPRDGSLEGTPLAGVLPGLLEAASGDGSPTSVLILQGLVLEQLGATLYRSLAQGGRLSSEGQAVAEEAALTSEAVLELAAARLTEHVAGRDERFYAFTSRTSPLFRQLDELGVAIDSTFSEPLNLEFADVMGDFVADLLPTCTQDLGFERRKVMVHLTSAFMA